MKLKVVILLTAILLLGLTSTYGQLQSNSPYALEFNNGHKIAVVPDGSSDAGTICIVWVNSVNGGPEGYIWYAESTDGGITWAKQRIDTQTSGEICLNPSIAIAPDGTRCVVWVEESTAFSYLRFSYKKSGESWQPPICMGGTMQFQEIPSIAVDNVGKIHISYRYWFLDMAESAYIYYLGFTIADISKFNFPGAFVTCLAGGLCYNGAYYFGTSAVATDGSNHPLVMWRGKSTVPYSSFDNGIYYNFNNGAWINGGVKISPSVDMPAVSGSGGTFFYGVWNSSTYIYFSSYDGSKDSWSPLELVNSGTSPVVTALNDNIIVAWENQGQIYYSERQGQNNWSSPVKISNSFKKSASPHIALSPDDKYLYVIWVEGDNAQYEIRFLKIHKGTDVFIRDCPWDVGSVPSSDACENGCNWVSPDIWLERPPGTWVPDPQVDEDNWLYCRVWNIGCQTAYNTTVQFYWNDFGLGWPPPIASWKAIGALLTIPTLAPGASTVVGPVTWHPTATEGSNHRCIFAKLSNSSDPDGSGWDSNWDNNIGWRNFTVQGMKCTTYPDTVICTAEVDLKVGNPDSLLVHNVFLDISLEDWPPSWKFELTSPDSLFSCIFEPHHPYCIFYSMGPWEVRDVTLTVTAPGGTENDTGTVHIKGTADGSPIGGVSVQVVPPKITRNKLEIGQIDSVNPGDIVSVPVLMKNPEEVGGFNLYIEFDPTVLYFKGVERGSGLPEGFEYFTYRQLPCPNCGCCKYKLQVLGLYDIKNLHQGVPIPPRDYQDTLFKIIFKVANDNNLRGFKIPIRWEWDPETCTENTKSDTSGYILYVSADTSQYNFNDCPTQPGSQVYPSICFIDGGIEIVTTGEKEIGDINLNGIPFDPGDVTLFSSYFIYGTEVFVIDPPLQIALTDINRDGFTLSLSDFIYMLRVILHDVSQPKPAPAEQVVTITAKRQNSHLTVSSDQPLGAALLLFNYTGEVKNLSSPFAINSNIENSKGELKLLVYMKDATGVSGELLRFQATGEIKLSKVEAVDNQGRTVKVVAAAKTIPEKFALYQNHPNPFNLETQISFDLPVNSKVSLKIYNITGQLVRTLIDKDMEAGQHKVIWDGKNQKGETVASGIYFYRLEAGDYVSVKKMGLVK